MSVGRICLREVDLAEPGENVLDAARRMRERRVGTLVILDDAGKPVGLVTDRDLALRVVAAGGDPRATLVGEVMTEHPETVTKFELRDHTLQIEFAHPPGSLIAATNG